MERSRTQRTTSGASVGPASRTASARRYSHVRSVVKDLIDEKITPLEAQYSRSVLRQQPEGRSSFSVTRGQSCDVRGDSRGRESPITPRRNISAALTGGKRVDSPTPISSLLTSPRVVSREGGTNKQTREYTPLGTARRTYRVVSTSYSRNISQYACVSQIVENLENAVVPYNHVPRCAQEIPERYKYQPPLPPSKDASVERKRPKWCSTPSRAGTPFARTNSIPAIRRVGSTGRTSLATGLSRQHTANSARSVGNSERKRSLLTSTSQKNGAPETRESHSAKERKDSLDSKRSQSGVRGGKQKSKEEKEVISFQPLQGIDRVLLFDTEPPKLVV
ncbi:hypothetical protein LSM04_004546 [Trypanosoma melophagium]|uniref:uncharacterized protein n=1 Tax=Trypanosoma melophagium TaxID=715481 RepID=UPI00351A2F76|nr:hypothetical protein LSM04_004546 [Trypanosoma melophagium]